MAHNPDADLHSLVMPDTRAYIHPHNRHAYEWLFERLGEQHRRAYEADQPLTVSLKRLIELTAEAETAGLTIQAQHLTGAAERN